MYYLKHKQECFIKYKTWEHSLNGLKNYQSDEFIGKVILKKLKFM
jgi:hypothetical protein